MAIAEQRINSIEAGALLGCGRVQAQRQLSGLETRSGRVFTYALTDVQAIAARRRREAQERADELIKKGWIHLDTAAAALGVDPEALAIVAKVTHCGQHLRMVETTEIELIRSQIQNSSQKDSQNV